jgi:hypothetical protein
MLNKFRRVTVILYIYIIISCNGVTPGGSSTVHIYTQAIHITQWDRIYRTYITIKIHKPNNKNT